MALEFVIVTRTKDATVILSMKKIHKYVANPQGLDDGDEDCAGDGPVMVMLPLQKTMS